MGVVGKNWYLLRKHRVEGPLKVEDLQDMAGSGHISPDDYVIEESDYKQGNLVYKKVMVLLEISDFKKGLERPNGSLIEPPKSTSSNGSTKGSIKESNSEAAGAQRESESLTHPNHEVVSDLESLASSMSFGKVASFCVAVVVGMWGYDNYVGNSAKPRRLPANSSQTDKVKAEPGNVKKSVILSQPKKEEVADQRVEKLMPTERPKARMAPTRRPEPAVASSPAPPATSKANMARDDDRDRDFRDDDRGDDRNDLNDRGLASDRDDADWELSNPDGLDLPPGEMMPSPEEFMGDDDGAYIDEPPLEEY